ncbi:MAG: hypothetical protein ER33_10650 [Cyanobium sp. CACIAM 14]|nr:MAG: hypothetical protein ER33_10650 [Cyanobium sp. CACIAM 14]
MRGHSLGEGLDSPVDHIGACMGDQMGQHRTFKPLLSEEETGNTYEEHVGCDDVKDDAAVQGTNEIRCSGQVTSTQRTALISSQRIRTSSVRPP